MGSAQNAQYLGVSIPDAYQSARDPPANQFFPSTPNLVPSAYVELPVSATSASAEIEVDATQSEEGGSPWRSSRRRSADLSTSDVFQLPQCASDEDLVIDFQLTHCASDEDLIFQLAHCASDPSDITTVPNEHRTSDDRCSSNMTVDTSVTDSGLEPGDQKLMEALAAECCGGRVVKQNAFVTASHDSDFDLIQSQEMCGIEEQDFLLRSFSDSHSGVALEESWCV